jgi:hypothetical protein
MSQQNEAWTRVAARVENNGRRAQWHLAVVLLALAACGCAGMAIIRARNDLEQSKAQYKDCLQHYADAVERCEGVRRSYEADLKVYQATTRALQAGITIEGE